MKKRNRLNNLQDKLLRAFVSKNRLLYLKLSRSIVNMLSGDNVDVENIDKELNKEITILTKEQGELIKDALSLAYIYINKDRKKAFKVLNENWNELNYTERLYKDKIKLKKILIKEISRGLKNKDDNEEIIKRVSRRLDISINNAKRLVNTEMTAVINRAELDKGLNKGKTRFRFVATIDARTSEVCKDMNDKVFNIEDYKIGVNVGPLHPNCRSRIEVF